jgi:Beta-galactosidase/beta-glucuronidase
MRFDENRLKDPAFFCENRLAPHSDHRCVPDFRYSLNGLWKFFHAVNPAQVVPGFEQPEFDCRGWKDIHVPAHIQTEGWGTPQYCNVQYPWDGIADIMPGELPAENPVSCYVRYFRLPENMKGKRLFVSFQGVESCVALWLNGTYIGFSSDSFTPHEFELTNALVEGENKLACRVYRWCSGSWLEDQDFLRFSGIFREVYLYAVSPVHVRHLKIVAEPDESRENGILQWRAATETPAGTRLAVCLKDGENVLAEAEGTVSGIMESAGSLRVKNPRLWSAEDPYLYELRVKLTAPDGTEETAIQPVGFRKIEIRNSVILVNGVRVVFKGVNRHDFCGETGRAVPEEKIRRDLLTMKRNNINAIRTSHYPNSSALYRLCDELGFYVIDENNMESHGMWDMLWQGKITKDQIFPGARKEWEPLLLDRIRSVVERDRNHPSVIIWSCGNESLTGPVILAMSREFRRLDPTRPVHY